ncbi:hypothetical protein ACGC1H_006256 [Rhizoctonia solani]
MAKAVPVAGPSKGSSLKAPAVPVDPKIGTRLAARAKQIYDEDPEAAQANWDSMQERLDELAFIFNPYVARNRQYMINAHTTFLSLYQPDLPVEDHWNTNVVIQFAANIFVHRVTTSRGKDGGPIQSRTAVGWLGHYIHAICTYTRDPFTLLRTGLTVLRRGLYVRLENILKWCVIEYGLIRHSNIQQRLDRDALQLIFEVMIKRTKHHGRAVAFQTMNAANFALSGALRSGSLQANNPQYAKQGMYMKAGDCEISVVRPYCYSVKVTIDHWKGYSGVVGERKVLTFGPVTKAHNLIFEPAVTLILDFMARKGFKDIENPTQLFACKSAILEMKDSFKSMPLWLRRGPGGLSVIEGVPAGPHALSHSLSYLGFQAGINNASIHALRRYSGNIYALTLGRELTLYLLNHNDRTGKVMDNHYTTGVQDMPLTQLLHGELKGQLTKVEQMALEANRRTSAAMNFLICRVQSTNPEIDVYTDEATVRGRYGLTKDEEAIEDDDHIKLLKKQASEAWDDIMALVPAEKRVPYTNQSGKRLSGLLKKVPLKDRDRAQARAGLFRSVNNRVSQARRKAVRDIRTQKTKSKARVRPEATYEDRDAAEKELDKESPWYGEVREMLEKQVKDYLHAKGNPAKHKLTKEEAEAAAEPHEIQDQISQLEIDKSNSDDEDEDEGSSDEDDEEVTAGNPPLPGNQVPRPNESSTNKGKAKISAIQFNLQQKPQFDVGEEPTGQAFDDSQEPDGLGVDVDPARGLLIRCLWNAHKEQIAKKKTWKRGEGSSEEEGEGSREGSSEEGEGSNQEKKKSKKKGKKSKKKGKPPAQEGRLSCDLCPQFASRQDKIATFLTVTNLERHKREKHDEWSNLELKMETEDPETFKCPGCHKKYQSLVSCKIHCWRDCPQKAEFLPLYQAHEALRPTRAANIVDQDNRRQEELGNVGGPYSVPSYGTQMALDMQTRLKDNPDALQQWADRNGGLVTNLTRGISMGDIQQSFAQLAGLAVGQPYEGQVPEDSAEASLPGPSEIQPGIALGSNFMSQRKARMVETMAANMELNPSDYDEDSEPEDDDEDEDDDEN